MILRQSGPSRSSSALRSFPQALAATTARAVSSSRRTPAVCFAQIADSPAPKNCRMPSATVLREKSRFSSPLERWHAVRLVQAARPRPDRSVAMRPGRGPGRSAPAAVSVRRSRAGLERLHNRAGSGRAHAAMDVNRNELDAGRNRKGVSGVSLSAMFMKSRKIGAV